MKEVLKKIGLPDSEIQEFESKAKDFEFTEESLKFLNQRGGKIEKISADNGYKSAMNLVDEHTEKLTGVARQQGTVTTDYISSVFSSALESEKAKIEESYKAKIEELEKKNPKATDEEIKKMYEEKYIPVVEELQNKANSIQSEFDKYKGAIEGEKKINSIIESLPAFEFSNSELGKKLTREFAEEISLNTLEKDEKGNVFVKSDTGIKTSISELVSNHPILKDFLKKENNQSSGKDFDAERRPAGSGYNMFNNVEDKSKRNSMIREHVIKQGFDPILNNKAFKEEMLKYVSSEK